MTGFMVDLNPSMGCLFIGIDLSLVLYGGVCAQAVYYFWHYRNDGLVLKTLVVMAWVLQSAQIATDIHQLWYYLIRGHGNILALTVLDPATGGQSLLSHALMVLVQWYFLHRIWLLLKGTRVKCFYAGFAAFVSLMTLGTSIWVVYDCFIEKSVTTAVRGGLVPGIWSLSAIFVTDLYITCILCYALWGCRNGFQQTDGILTRLVIYAINRGILLCLASFVAIVLWVIDSKGGTTYIEAISAPGQGTLYANSLLAVLNVRNHLGQLEATRSDHNASELPFVTIRKDSRMVTVADSTCGAKIEV
ncbi:uncharacterized protein B0H18DRAFT_1029219 [Fomitopsis serialis]|uniref:uncharacterized protein n=1 Tax=Fomitopsis serialis TaxID=139415 RepID=UPI0020072F90|nr:uncharacterized protein B0H18DRAFT_1029219 [Neoantrodia serialis]KAH9919115.1 hypothetical protein B0H18DRAFT_1029219 [Neoantrodia serialis]